MELWKLSFTGIPNERRELGQGDSRTRRLGDKETNGQGALVPRGERFFPASHFQLPTSNFPLPTSSFQLPTSRFHHIHLFRNFAFTKTSNGTATCSVAPNCRNGGGKSGQHRAPYFLTGRFRSRRKQQVPQKITVSLPLAAG